MTAHQALSHPFVAGELKKEGEDKGSDLLPIVKKNFNARRTLHAAIDTVRAINKLREGQHGMMEGAKATEPARGAPPLANVNNGDGADKAMSMDRDSGYGTATDGRSSTSGTDVTRSETRDADGDVRMKGVERNTGQGQTEAQILAQTRKIAETTKGLWQSKR